MLSPVTLQGLDQNEPTFGLKRPASLSFDDAKPACRKSEGGIANDAHERQTRMLPILHRRFAAAHARPTAVREIPERCTLPVKPEPMEPLSDQPVRVNITQWVLPGLGIMKGTLCALQQRIRPERFAPTGADDIFLNLSMAGTSVL